jgi:hypothetical protein
MVLSPLTPLKKGGNRFKVPLAKGDLGGFLLGSLAEALDPV